VYGSLHRNVKLTGHVPPATILSNDKASGMPLVMEEVVDDAMDSLMEDCFSSPLSESRGDRASGGR